VKHIQAKVEGRPAHGDGGAWNERRRYRQVVGQGKRDGKPVRDPLQSLANTRRTAIVLISSGVGLILFFLTLTWIVDEHEVLSGAAIGLIPLAIGVGFLIDYNCRSATCRASAWRSVSQTRVRSPGPAVRHP
jgi:hypothetical protein